MIGFVFEQLYGWKNKHVTKLSVQLNIFWRFINLKKIDENYDKGNHNKSQRFKVSDSFYFMSLSASEAEK